MITCIYGAPRVGKSTLARQLIKARKRHLILDPCLEIPAADWVDSFDAARKIDWSGDFSVQWTADPNWDFFYSLDNYLLAIDEANVYWPNGRLEPELSRFFTRGGQDRKSVV